MKKRVSFLLKSESDIGKTSLKKQNTQTVHSQKFAVGRKYCRNGQRNPE